MVKNPPMVRRLVLQAITLVVVPGVFFALYIAGLQTYENPWMSAAFAWAAVPVLACFFLAFNSGALVWPERRLLFAACVAIASVFGLFLFVLPGCQQVNSAHAKFQIRTRLTEIGKAVNAYCDGHGGRLPPAAIHGKDGQPLLSWRVALLPYLGHDALFRRFKLDEPWDSAHNIVLANEMPVVFAIPDYLAGSAGVNTTRYQVYVGPGTAFECRTGVGCDDFPDGKGNTLLVVVGANAVPWTKPADLEFRPQGPLARPVGFTSWDYPIVLFADGKVDGLRPEWTDAEIKAFITRNGREPLPTNRY